jgi:ribosomal-protein-alanine N-acetyltransferase
MTALASKPLRIRQASRTDLAAMLRIEQASFADPWTVDSLSTALALERMRVLVAEAAGMGTEGGGAAPAVLGYVVALVVGPEAEIADLAVTPDARRLGIGRALLEEAIAEVATAGVRTVYLEVRESNQAARMLYASNGFAPVGRRRGYYRSPVEDALVLRRDLDPT